MKNSKAGFEQEILFKIKVNHTLNTKNNDVVGGTIICNYYLTNRKVCNDKSKIISSP